jgi:hypothetical protein
MAEALGGWLQNSEKCSESPTPKHRFAAHLPGSSGLNGELGVKARHLHSLNPQEITRVNNGAASRGHRSIVRTKNVAFESIATKYFSALGNTKSYAVSSRSQGGNPVNTLLTASQTRRGFTRPGHAPPQAGWSLQLR